MKKFIPYYLSLFFIIICSCVTENPLTEFQPGNGGLGPGGEMPGGQGGMQSGALIDLDVLSSFTVEFDETSFSEKENIPTDSADPDFGAYIENDFSPKNTTTIRFTDNGAEIEGMVKGDTITADGGHVLVKAYGKGLKASIEEYIYSEETPDYDPIVEYLNQLPAWDGRNRVRELFQRLLTALNFERKEINKGTVYYIVPMKKIA